MQKHPDFNFERELQNLLPLIKIQNQQTNPNPIDHTRSIDSLKQEVTKLQKEEEHTFKQQSTCMTQTETLDCLIHAFSLSSPLHSQITIVLVKKSNGKSSKLQLQPIKVQTLLLKFASASTGQLHLLSTTSCGRIFTHTGFESKHLSVSALKISSDPILDLLVPSFPDSIFALSANNIIYWVNFSSQSVLCQFQCEVPLIEDRKTRLILDNSELYLAQVFSYGRIIVWEISPDLKLKFSVNLDNSLSTNRSHDQEQPHLKITQNYKANQQETKRMKQIILKPKMSIMGMLTDGIIWVDFMGQFLIVITAPAQLRVLAININQYNESQQLYTVISELSLRRNTLNGKKVENETIAHVMHSPENKTLLIGKQLTMEQNRKRPSSSQIVIEKYWLDPDFKPFKLLTIQFTQTNLIREFQLSHCRRFLVVTNDHQFTIVMSPHLFS